MTLPVNDIVSVAVSVEPQLPTVPVNLGSLVVLGNSARLPFGARLQYYSDLNSVAGDFNTSDPEYIAAKTWFGRTPAPRTLGIARRFNAATPGELLGAAVGSLSALTAVANGSFTISIDGVAKNATGIDLTGCVSFAAVAAAIQTELASLAAGTTVTYWNGSFIVRSGTTGTSSTVSYTTVEGAGTYLGILLGLDASLKGTITPGIAAETVTTSLAAIRNLDQSWYGLFVTPEIEDNSDIQAIAAWAEAQFVRFFYSSADGNAIVSSSSADIFSLLKAASYDRSVGQWDNLGNANSAYDILSAAACLLTTDFTQPNAAKILKFQLEPGVTPVPITESQRITLESKNANYYATFGNTNMFSPGKNASGRFVDESYGLDALNLTIQNNVFALMVGRTSKIAQTDRDVSAIAQAIEAACKQFVDAGFLAPGYWKGASVGSIKTGDFLKKGYYVYIAPVASQSPTDRQARLAPPITVICCGAGAVQQISINLNFQR